MKHLALIVAFLLTTGCHKRFLGTTPGAQDTTSLRPKAFILAGQSNMVGIAKDGQDEAQDPRIQLFDNADTMREASEPIDDATNQVDQVSNDGHEAGHGLGMTFAKAYLAKHPQATVILIPCAKSASRSEDWQPGRPLFESMIRRARAVKESGADIAGVIYWQGESEADGWRTDSWAQDFTNTVNGIRSALGSVPVVYMQLGSARHIAGYEHWDEVRTQQASISMASVVMAQAPDGPTDGSLHFMTEGYRESGRRMAQAYMGVEQ